MWGIGESGKMEVRTVNGPSSLCFLVEKGGDGRKEGRGWLLR